MPSSRLHPRPNLRVIDLSCVDRTPAPPPSLVLVKCAQGLFLVGMVLSLLIWIYAVALWIGGAL